MTTDPTGNAPVKSPTAQDYLRESPRWPVSPRLRSPPPILHKPNLVPPRRGEQETPSINLQRATPPQPSGPDVPSDTDTDDAYNSSGVRTPARGPNGTASTLETVQEVSPLGSPRGTEVSMEEKLEDSFISETSQPDAADNSVVKNLVGRAAAMVLNESGSESGSVKAGRRSGPIAAPPLTTRQSSSSVKPGLVKGKAGEISLQNMTVETETVTSIPQVALAPGGGAQSTSSTLRQKPSTETIRPKKEKKKSSRKQPAVTAGTGEPSNLFQPKRRHHPTIRSVASVNEFRSSPMRYLGPYDDAASLRPGSPAARRQSFVSYPMSSILTRHRPASSKADIFEAKVASAVEEANSSDSEETFVYDSNPPERAERPARFHSRTPSATSMASQVERSGMRSIHAVLESAPPITVKKSMKFVNSYNSNANDSAPGEDDGKGTGRSNVGAGSARGTVRHHHHFGRWGRNGGGNGHPSLFAEQSPFGASIAAGNSVSRQSSGPPSPRFNGRGAGTNGKRNAHLAPGYEFEDTTTGADDETTPLIPSGTMRSSRSGRSRRGLHSLRTMESQSYRCPPSVLNRFASCLVLTVMLLLVVSGAIGFMFATSQPLTEVELISMTHVVASQQELMLDLTIRAYNPNVVVVVVDAADVEVFAKSPHAGTDSEWWRTHPGDDGPFEEERKKESVVSARDDAPQDPPLPPDDSAPNMRLGTITGFDSALTFEGSFLHSGPTSSIGAVRLNHPGNGTYGGPERWENIMKDEFQLILKGVLKYTLPLSQRVRTATIIGKTTVKPNAADPGLPPNSTEGRVSISF